MRVCIFCTPTSTGTHIFIINPIFLTFVILWVFNDGSNDCVNDYKMWRVLKRYEVMTKGRGIFFELFFVEGDCGGGFVGEFLALWVGRGG